MKKIISLTLCFVMLFVSVCFASPSATIARAATKQELEDEIKRIDEEIEANKGKLNDLADEKDEQQKYLDTLEAQTEAVRKKLSNLETQIQAIDNEIADYDAQLKQLQNEIDIIKEEIKEAQAEIVETKNSIESSKQLLSRKLRASYINGSTSTVKILMGAKSLASFLTRLEMMKRMAQEDKRVINEFKAQVEKLKEAKAKLEKSKAELDGKYDSVNETKALTVAKKDELTNKQAEYDKAADELEKEYAKVEDFISELDRSSSVYKNYISKLTQERQEADEEIDRILKEYYASLTTTTASSGSESSTTSSYTSSDTWLWPLGKASCYISSSYGNRSASISGWSFHGGIDISTYKVVGVPIYATRGGTVIVANVITDDPYGAKGRGYANYVMIDHGDGYATLYGHCWQVNVKSGQKVSKGQQIATVGSTGNSTGPHLHFEVRYNGAKQDPMKYVKK